jgi:hypothetical protein
MIPRQRDANPRFENDVRLRVHACRQRLRRIRSSRNLETGERAAYPHSAELEMEPFNQILRSAEKGAEAGALTPKIITVEGTQT